MTEQFTYIGSELELFDHAKNWKRYCASCLRKYIKGNVLEVGAGGGNNTKWIGGYDYQSWLAIEPDIDLSKQLTATIDGYRISNCHAFHGTLTDLKPQLLFDAIVYLDVLEHILDDRQELALASRHLAPGGYLIVLAPAHQWLFTPFDTAIGHHRRYNKTTLTQAFPPDIKLTRAIYLDCVGLLASLGNRLLLKQSQPTLKQIQLWDQYMVTLSQKIDPVLRYSLGKSVLAIGQKM
jgi:SAM-dependent methyltransferase